MNKRIRKKVDKKIIRLAEKMPADTIKTDSKGCITNWHELSKSTKDWIIKG